MASSFVPVDHARNGFTIVTHVVPGGTEQYVPGTGGGVSTQGPLKKLLNREPKALGTVQIMIGIMTLLFGIVSVIYFKTVSVFSGVTFWGSCSYIASGALCIVAINQTHPCVLVFRMASHVIPVENAGNGFTILTHVIPPQTAPGGLQEVSTLREPKALGTVQILIGIVTYLFGIVSAVHFNTVSGYSDISRWGSMIYISSGALTVAAANQPRSFVARSSLVMNIISAVAAGVAVILLFIDMSPFWYYRFNYESYGVWRVSRGISGVLLVFSVLQFIVSICTSVFACKAVCTACCAGAPAVFIISNPETHNLAEEKA